MGLKTGNSVVYLSIVGGKLARRLKVKSNTSVTRVTKENTTVEEEYFKSLEGTIVGLDIKQHDKYKDTLLVYVQDDQLYCLQMSLDGRYGGNFLKTLPNVQLNMPVEIVPSEKEKDGKKDYTIFIKQNGVALKRFYNKDSGIPEPVLTKGKRGKPDEWDYTPVNDFLYENVFVPYKAGLKEQYKINIPADNVHEGSIVDGPATDLE